MTNNTLFERNDLVPLMGDVVTEETVTMVERIVWGWLRPILQADARPQEISDELFAAAVELGAIAAENPTGLASYQLGAERLQYSAERRRQILDEVAAFTAGAGTVPATKEGLPAGRFPRPEPYPDPAGPAPLSGW